MSSDVRRRPITNAGDGTPSSSSSVPDADDFNRSANEQIGVAHRNSNGENVDRRRSVMQMQYAYRPCTPAHNKIKESPLSSDAIFKQSHAGLFNLCIVVLVAVNSRLIIENLMKYGLLINANFWFSSRSLRDWPLLMCCLSLPFFPLAAYVVEKFAWTKRISDYTVITLHIIITTIAILYPVFMTLRFDSAVLSGVTLMLFACVNWLKLVSFVHANYDMCFLVNSIDKLTCLLFVYCVAAAFSTGDYGICWTKAFEGQHNNCMNPNPFQLLILYSLDQVPLVMLTDFLQRKFQNSMVCDDF
ncbi:hypothetical protein E3N88_29079 [Mikania micrantha]|uniref:diacylglycerol O-acyltransferase n=1 Tax=Mikania micrantha TaxID=192012 RepID=A0A5N6N1N2_9ASTR|nr:hypothetical protein E3N88_29079 [Mikania micrantha]